MAVKKELRNEGLRYSLLLPVHLKIMLDSNTHFSDSLEEAWNWLEAYRTGTGEEGRSARMATEEPCLRRSQRTRRRRQDVGKPTVMPTQVE